MTWLPSPIPIRSPILTYFPMSSTFLIILWWSFLKLYYFSTTSILFVSKTGEDGSSYGFSFSIYDCDFVVAGVKPGQALISVLILLTQKSEKGWTSLSMIKCVSYWYLYLIASITLFFVLEKQLRQFIFNLLSFLIVIGWGISDYNISL